MSKQDPFDFNTLPIISEDTEFFPLMSQQDEDDMNSEETPEILSILPLRNTVLFPGVVIPITVGRDKSIKLIKEAYKGDRVIGVVTQKDVSIEDPTLDQLHSVGTVAHIIKMLQMPDGNTTVIIQGKQRFQLVEEVQSEPFIKAIVAKFTETKHKNDKEFKSLVAAIKEMSSQIIQLSPNIPSEAGIALKNIESTSFLINFISSNMNAEMADKQKMLEMGNLRKRADMVMELLTQELQMLELKNQIQTKVRTDLDKQQRDYFLNQQLKTIQEELGNSTDLEFEALETRSKKKKWKVEVKEHFKKELEKLGRMNPAAPDYSIQMNYLELLLDLPWNEFTKDNFDLKRAQRVLDKDHFGLEKVKQRIIEYLAVLKLKRDMKAPILCLVGPPGVGKTSLGKSIAKALNRKYVRMALGGVRDEAEIRGHRKTYIGAMPGRIIQSIKKAGADNPVFVLDEIDKVGSDFRGDPSSALLEMLLDPEQNNAFNDHYVEAEYDLSNVLFIATANSLSTIQPALLDRMEIIEVNGYTIEEKIEIAKKYLLPKQKEVHGLDNKQITLKNSLIEKVIEDYTRESGVRGLEKKIGSLVRGVATKIAMDEPYEPTLDNNDVEKILGAPIFDKDAYEGNEVAGVVTGLAWTQVGGDILFIEASLSPGKGKLTLTGNLGDVMKESAVIALAYIRAHATQFGIDHELFDNFDLHVHVPAGATPKDGPSAGITMLTALVSAFTQRKVKQNLAMTGEITLRGKVLPVGGIKEKILAAKRANIKEIILCKSNRKDILEIKEDYIKDLQFHYVTEMQEVINLALTKDKVKNPIDLTIKTKPSTDK
ncbi:endopeptidase La [Pedobacter sp. SL55]|uniref:endopeptidase La n=1 Tax=Pedobacter sp. SL55 TaxID=2995161 RepID=UPI00226FD0C9|nr:endopeptidase La [Pedobacter sp. SL55]WAC39206.1 endopeptidase La [Pedobacter sp. SL55]